MQNLGSASYVYYILLFAIRCQIEYIRKIEILPIKLFIYFKCLFLLTNWNLYDSICTMGSVIACVLSPKSNVALIMRQIKYNKLWQWSDTGAKLNHT